MSELYNQEKFHKQSSCASSCFVPDEGLKQEECHANENFTDEDNSVMDRGVHLFGNEDFKDIRSHGTQFLQKLVLSLNG